MFRAVLPGPWLVAAGQPGELGAVSVELILLVRAAVAMVAVPRPSPCR
jgi:hypothetical protein